MVLSQMFKNSFPAISLYLFGQFFLSPWALVTLELSIPPHRLYYFPPTPYHSSCPQAKHISGSCTAHELARCSIHTARPLKPITLRPVFAHSCRWTTHTAFVYRSFSCAKRKHVSSELRVLALQVFAVSSYCSLLKAITPD
jgi:hypothetical protein